MGTEHILNALEVRNGTRYDEVSYKSRKFECIEQLNAQLLDLLEDAVNPGQELVLDISKKGLRVRDADTGAKIDIHQTKKIRAVCNRILGMFAQKDAQEEDDWSASASDAGTPQSPPSAVETAQSLKTHGGEKVNHDLNGEYGEGYLGEFANTGDWWAKRKDQQAARKAQREGCADKVLREKVGAAEVLEDEKGLAPPPPIPAQDPVISEQEQVMNEQGAMIQELDKQLDASRKKEASMQKALEQALKKQSELRTALQQEKANRKIVQNLRQENTTLREEIAKRDQQYSSILQTLASSESSLKTTSDTNSAE